MGIEIDRTQFDDADRARFIVALEAQLEELSALLERPGFGCGPATLGSELELYITDDEGYPAHRNQELCEAARDPQLTLELNRYNLEYNLSAYELAGDALRSTEREVLEKVGELSRLGRERGLQIVPIGILPTLRTSDFGDHCVTERQRYRALVAQLINWRGSDFHVDINGAEPLKLAMADITLEGANTSFQVHLRVNPEDYASRYNAVQLATPLAVAISANSPGLFGHQLWDETRIPLFKQSIDTRHLDRYRWSEPARVCFGHGWARRGARELFAQTVRLYPPLLPVCDDRPPRGGLAPELAELRLHQGTVWLWNRPIYDDADGGHLRIEMRALPAGPTAVDMVAGAAFLIGLSAALGEQMEALMPALPFPLAEYNFYRAAQHGLDARLVWPDLKQHGLRERPIVDVIAEMLPRADDGLRTLGVEQAARDHYLGVLERRLARKRTGASWQRDMTRQFMRGGKDKQSALAAMLAYYRELSAANEPVAEWPL